MAGMFRIEIRGLEELRFLLSRSQRQASLVMASALYAEATVIFNETQRVTPVRYGILRGSGSVDPPVITANEVEVTIGYGGPSVPYATFVHERVYGANGKRIRHDPPTKAKFLEEPVLAAENGFANRVGQRVAGEIFSVGGKF